MKRASFFIITLFLILMPLVNAAPPPQVNINTDIGYDIEFSKIEVLETNKNFTFNFHIFNRSNGLRLDNSSVDCSLHLFNSIGEHQFIDPNLTFNTDHGDWEILMLGSNFSQGNYQVLVDCNNGNFGGFVSFPIHVTPTGEALETSDSITYIILTASSILLFLLCLYGGIALPFRNRRNEEGGIISIEKLKYFKVGLLFLSYVLFVWVLNLLFSLSNNFSILTQYTGFFKIMFLVINSMSYPVFVLMIILMGALAWRDLNLKELLKRGFNPQ